MAVTYGFPIIGAPSVWSNWNSYGTGAWNTWFMAPYGEWVYCGFVKSDTPAFRKINIGTTNANYEISSWDFGITANPPEDIFPHETDDGYPNGSMNMGVIRGATPKLYLAGRSAAAPNTSVVLHRFLVNDDFTQEAPGTIPLDTVGGGGSVLNVNHIAGIEVVQGTAIYIVTNNDDGNEFMLRRYPYTWAGGNINPTHEKELSTSYMENNTNARIRGIGIANDDSIIVFVNSGVSATDCKVLKFDPDDLTYEGQTTWNPGISTNTWGMIIPHSEVFMLFYGLNSTSSLDWKTAIFYDNATAVPSEEKSNFIIAENLTQYGSDDAVTLTYQARDRFNIPVVGVSVKFAIDGEDEDDNTTWTDTIGSIQDDALDTFFNADGTPTAVSAIVTTNGSGVGTAYYKPMRSGSGSQRDLINVYCPSDS